MIKKDEKRGLSSIVATLLIILLVLVAVAFLWAVVRNVIQGNAEQVSLGKFTLDLKIKGVVRDAGENSMDVRIKRNPGEGEFSGLAFIVEDEENSEAFEIDSSLSELEERTFNITLSSAMSVDELKEISIAPIFTLKSGKEVVGNIADVYIFPPNLGTNGTNCTSNCVGKICGSDGCGGNCGTCPTGICNSTGQCVITTPQSTCGDLSTAGATYTLTSNVTSIGTCFTISAQNIILDCNNNWITYSTGGGANTYGVYINQPYTTIINCNIVDGNWMPSLVTRNGIYLDGSDNGVLNNNFVSTSKSAGVYVYNGANFNTLTNNIVRSNSSSAIWITQSSNNLLTNNNGTSVIGYGIFMDRSSNNTLTDNYVLSNITAIYLSSSQNNTLKNNKGRSTVLNNEEDGSGIYLYGSSNNTLINNLGISNMSAGIWLTVFSNNNTLINNTGTSNLYNGIMLEASNNNILTSNTGTSEQGAGINIYSYSKNNTLINNKGTCLGSVSNICLGISVVYNSNNTVLTSNTGKGNSWYGILIDRSSNNTLTNNIATSYGDIAIEITLSSDNTLTNNTGTSEYNTGIDISYNSSNNNLTNNIGTSLQSWQGISLHHNASNNVLINNIGVGNDQAGIFIYFNSNNNLLINNTATSNTNSGLSLSSSSNNNFIGQTATGGTYGFYINSNSSMNAFQDCGVITGGTQNVYISVDSLGNTFTNCPY
jgi:parallel beta-helix repeat protein